MKGSIEFLLAALLILLKKKLKSTPAFILDIYCKHLKFGIPSKLPKSFAAFTGFETKNKFTVKNSLGQKVYYAVEDNDCLTRNCCGPLRPFDMKILDNYRTEVIHLHRPLACDSCCFPCCLQVWYCY